MKLPRLNLKIETWPELSEFLPITLLAICYRHPPLSGAPFDPPSFDGGRTLAKQRQRALGIAGGSEVYAQEGQFALMSSKQRG
ncbi:hypothetical protein GWI33_009864 [Rhynchophorus ferrugineus]|uniref:Uncharacterized protein n=1 Tax=Rhynchophorus ferrugineus TaxID=354439 RepID=A0A834IES0_RHYFE|nr:hypothetical protein GWI33_009864 [Rhynchophorus ferrugineus]